MPLHLTPFRIFVAVLLVWYSRYALRAVLPRIGFSRRTNGPVASIDKANNGSASANNTGGGDRAAAGDGSDGRSVLVGNSTAAAEGSWRYGVAELHHVFVTEDPSAGDSRGLEKEGTSAGNVRAVKDATTQTDDVTVEESAVEADRTNAGGADARKKMTIADDEGSAAGVAGAAASAVQERSGKTNATETHDANATRDASVKNGSSSRNDTPAPKYNARKIKATGWAAPISSRLSGRRLLDVLRHLLDALLSVDLPRLAFPLPFSSPLNALPSVDVALLLSPFTGPLVWTEWLWQNHSSEVLLFLTPLVAGLVVARLCSCCAGKWRRDAVVRKDELPSPLPVEKEDQQSSDASQPPHKVTNSSTQTTKSLVTLSNRLLRIPVIGSQSSKPRPAPAYSQSTSANKGQAKGADQAERRSSNACPRGDDKSKGASKDPYANTVVQFQKRIAAAKIIQRWVRTRFRRWLRAGRRRPSIHPVAEQQPPYLLKWVDDDDGAIVSTIPETSEFAALSQFDFGFPDRACSGLASKAGGMAAEDVGGDDWGSHRCLRVRSCSTRRDLKARQDEASSEVSKIESCCSSLEGFPSAGTTPKGPRSSRLTLQKLWESSFCDWSAPITGLQLPSEIGVADIASQKLFGDLLPECKYQKPVTFGTVLEEIGTSGCVKLCEGCHSEVFRVSGHRGTGVIKVIRCEYLVRHLDLVLAEVRIGRTLRGLSKSLENNTAGFSELRDAYCVWDRYPEIMVNACIDYYSWKKSTQFNDEERELCRPYAVLYLSFAGVPLPKVTIQSALQLRSVVQQVALTLAVGEAALQFEHRALSASHVLVWESHDHVLPFWLDGRILFVDSFGLQASLIDFSAARLLLPPPESQPIFGDLNRMPTKKQEALGQIFESVFSAVGEHQSQFFPWTNLVFLEELTASLVRTYEGRFGGGAVVDAERQAWRDVCFWLELMPRCAGAKDFVDEVIVASARPASSLSVP